MENSKIQILSFFDLQILQAPSKAPAPSPAKSPAPAPSPAPKPSPSPKPKPSPSPKPKPSPPPRPILDRKECKNTPKGQLYPKGGRTIITLEGKGERLFWCNGGQLELNGKGNLHGDGTAKLVSTDGVWTGSLLYRLSDGLPQWTIFNSKTGSKRVIIAKAKPDARQDPDNNDPLTWDRRMVVKSSGPKPAITWVVRTNTTSGDLPTKCKGDIDEIVPFTAVYEMIACY